MYRLSLSGEPVEDVHRQSFMGVGLIRGEFVLRDRMQSLRIPAAREALQAYLVHVCEAFAGMPVWYRIADLWSDEAAVLAGALSEPDEHNPMLGKRGIRRAFDDPDLLALELDVVANVWDEHRNLHLLAPFVQDAEEYAQFLSISNAHGFRGNSGAMLEIPSALLDVRNFEKAGARNLLVGLNDLSCLTLGRDRGPKQMKLHPSVWKLVNLVRENLSDAVEWGIAGSLTPEVLSHASRSGASYLSIHYAEASALLTISDTLFPASDHVRDVKNRTEKAKRDMKMRTNSTFVV